MSRFATRVRFGVHVPSIGPSTWNWSGSALDSTGGNMNAVYDGTDWFTGVDIAGVAKLTSMAEGRTPQWQQGRGVDQNGALNNALAKTVAMNSNGTTAWVLSGGALPAGTGGIHKRLKAPGNKWELITRNYTGTAEGAIGEGRPVGHRRIYHDTATDTVYICAQRTSDLNGGIARSVAGAAFSDFQAGSGHTIGRMYRAVVGSEVGFSDVIYTCADNTTGNGSSVGNKPCVAVHTKASTGAPTFTRIDTIGTNNPGGITDAKTILCINEGGNDAIYVLVGENDATNGGLWRCTINGDPSTAGWQASPSLTWTNLNNSTLAAVHGYRALTGKRVGNATYIMVANNPSGSNTNVPQLTNNIPNTSAKKYRAAVYRSFNAHAANPTWQVITDSSNVSPGGVFNPMFGTTNETWVLQTGAMEENTIACVLGGGSWIAYDMDIDPVNDVIVIAGKSGSWISQNPWTTNAANVKWQPFSNQTGGVINTSIYVHPTDPQKWTMSDVDRAGYYNLDGGFGQMHGIASQTSTTAHANYIRQGGDYPGMWLLGNDSGAIKISTDWATTTNPNIAPTMRNDTVTTATGALAAVAEFTYAGSQYRLAIDEGQNSLHIKSKAGNWNATLNDGTAWAKVYNFGSVNSTSTIIANDGFKDFWVLVPASGLFYFPDVTNITNGSTVQTFQVNVASKDLDYCGRIAQDANNRTTLYVTWGNALKGMWKLTAANDLIVNSAGAKSSGSGTVQKVTSGALSGTLAYGAISVDPADNTMLVYVPTFSGIPDILYFDGSSWASIADDTFREVSGQATWVVKRGNHIYTAQQQAGTPFAYFS